ncbi:MAG TPA: hypothetical protein VGR37_24565 [Longimicrobiaceae bacterium]|nr:hypothetical protein [Longimicrobiaceae bacterium]
MPVLRRNALRLVPILLLAAAAPVGAQTVVDQGTFQISVGGQPAGREEFSIRQSGSGRGAEVAASGRVEVTLPGGTLELTPRLRARGLDAAPVSYQVDVGGDSPSRLLGQVGAGRFSARIVSASGEQLREYVASDRALVLDDGVAHHYYFLAQRERSGTVPVIVPRENRQAMATVSSMGEERVTIGGATVNLFHLVVRIPGSGERHVWVDALNRVIRVRIPESGYEAVRTEVPR